MASTGSSATRVVLHDLLHALPADAAIPPAQLKAKRCLGRTLVVVDEVRLPPPDRHGANLPSRLASARHEPGSIVCSSNKRVRD